ncbi:MAG: adenosylcobinamide-GDP ribazoletransferase [Symploca sp. SIO2B6]|nr:adenosylcobinamide-GDP ribazoletransferase [Symploca sp. SIO2B6]
MHKFLLRLVVRQTVQFWSTLISAVTFYTCIPIPTGWSLEFRGIAGVAPLVGLLIGGILGMIDFGLQYLGMAPLTRSALIVILWLALTGGLHLDGAMDTADGLATQNPRRRLEVMADSATGAFGAMTATAIMVLKISALTNLDTYRWLALMSAAGWGRWGQVMAIALYPYLKPRGKGAFHKQSMQIPQDILLGLLILLGLCGLPLLSEISQWRLSLAMVIGGGAIALLTGAWFHRQLGGHTGDTYGAVVEWTEALFLCLLTSI